MRQDAFDNLISIHPPRVGRDFSFGAVIPLLAYFNPPSPCGEGHSFSGGQGYPHTISIHPPRVGRDTKSTGTGQIFSISIHPPRVGRDRAARRRT